MALHEFEHTNGSQPTMDRIQARNLVLHGDPEGPKAVLHIADKAAIPPDLSRKVEPIVIEKILDKAAPRPSLPEVAVSLPETIDMSTPESVAATLALLEGQLKGTSGGLFGKGFVTATKDVTAQIENAPRNATRGEEQRAIIFNRLRARTNNWAQEIYEGGDPVHTIEYRRKDGIQEGVTAEIKLRITPHVIFALKSAQKSMYEKEIIHGPTQDLADMALEAKFDEHVVENELKKRKLKLEIEKKTHFTSENPDPETKETTPEKRKSLQALRQEVEKNNQDLGKPTVEEQVIFTLREVSQVLKSPSLDEPNPEAGKRIKAMMEVRL